MLQQFKCLYKSEDLYNFKPIYNHKKNPLDAGPSMVALK